MCQPVSRTSVTCSLCLHTGGPGINHSLKDNNKISHNNIFNLRERKKILCGRKWRVSVVCPLPNHATLFKRQFSFLFFEHLQPCKVSNSASTQLCIFSLPEDEQRNPLQDNLLQPPSPLTGSKPSLHSDKASLLHPLPSPSSPSLSLTRQ